MDTAPIYLTTRHTAFRGLRSTQHAPPHTRRKGGEGVYSGDPLRSSIYSVNSVYIASEEGGASCVGVRVRVDGDSMEEDGERE